MFSNYLFAFLPLLVKVFIEGIDGELIFHIF